MLRNSRDVGSVSMKVPNEKKSGSNTAVPSRLKLIDFGIVIGVVGRAKRLFSMSANHQVLPFSGVADSAAPWATELVRLNIPCLNSKEAAVPVCRKGVLAFADMISFLSISLLELKHSNDAV